MHYSKPTLALSAAVLGLGMMSSVASADGKITFVSWGGSYTASQVKACIEPYTAATGQEFNVVDYNGGLAEIKTQVEAGNVQWDIIDQTPQDAVRGCDEGLYEVLDHSQWEPAADGTPATEDFVEGALGELTGQILPLITPGIVSGALFAFITSFDEVVLIYFLADADQKTIPIQMWSGLRQQISPSILAVATLLITFSVILLIAIELLRRRSERLRGMSAQ